MRIFVVSDLHGNGEVYDSIIAYLENIAEKDEVSLYINGDLIDRGIDSYKMLEDVISRTNGKGKIKIYYLAGNHELMMYQAILKRKDSKYFSPLSTWMLNGGRETANGFIDVDDIETKYQELRTYLGNLHVYKLFDQKINGNKLLLVHAKAPKVINKECNLKISDNNSQVFSALWTRESDYFSRTFPAKLIGKNGYITIIGHTPVPNRQGFEYNKFENYINVDGGCAGYAIGMFEYDHVPLLEIEDNKLSIVTFNHNNQIICGNIFDGEIRKMDEIELALRRSFIEPSLNNIGENKRKLIKEYTRKK